MLYLYAAMSSKTRLVAVWDATSSAFSAREFSPPNRLASRVQRSQTRCIQRRIPLMPESVQMPPLSQGPRNIR